MPFFMVYKSLIVLLSASIAANCILAILFLRRRYQLSRIKNIHSALHGEMRLEKVLEVLSDEVARFGTKVVGTFIKNRKTRCLESETSAIPILEHSSMVKSFFALSPAKNNDKGDNEVDSVLKDKYGGGLSYIPVSMKWENPCWQINNCQDKECNCHSKKIQNCWASSEKHYRGTLLPSYREKSARCLGCRSFLPVAVLLTTGKSVSRSSRFINESFSGLVRTAVMVERLAYSASRDYLTGLLNKRGFQTKLGELLKLSLRYKHPLSLCMFDIDHFKKFNDEHGHQTGDFALKALSRLVAGAVRSTDVVARYGGEEFTIIMPETDKLSAFKALDKIRQKVADHKLSFQTGDLQIKISMGVAEAVADKAQDVQDLIKKADVALYHSKKTRNTVRAYDEKLGDVPKKSSEKIGTLEGSHARQGKGVKKEDPSTEALESKREKKTGKKFSRDTAEIIEVE